MRDSPVRLLAMVVLALALAAPAMAQENTTAGNETPVSNETGGETPATNETGGEPAAPAAPEPITIELEGHQDGSALYFTRVGETARNPTLTVQPGQKVTFKLTIVSGVHNLNVNDQAKIDGVLGEGESGSFEWTAPETPGRLQYWCDPHKASGMIGTLQVGTSAAPGPGEAEEVSGPTIDLGQYDPACAGVMVPAGAAEGIVGMPTLADYIEKCKAGDQPVVTVREKHAVDYVIPLSWLLIGVGIVGVVWVHKYYKP